MIIILSILVYFLLLLGLSWLTSRKADNRDFFIARHSSPWAMVAFGMLKTNVKLSRLKRTMSRPSADAAATFVSSATADRIRDRQLHFKREIDVRGMRADEAIQAVTYFIDDAIQFNQGEVRILHGTGTGALRQALRQYLDTVPGVACYRDEHVQFGGAGITVVTLA